MLMSKRTVTIEWGDCDPADIVYFPNYFRWFDASTAYHFAAAGLPKPELIRRYDVVGFPMLTTKSTWWKSKPASRGLGGRVSTSSTG